VSTWRQYMRRRAGRKVQAMFGRAPAQARAAAEQARRATGEVAQHLRQLGRRAAQSDIARMVMARLPDHLIERAVAAVVYRGQPSRRKSGPLPDPSWTAGYAGVAAVRVPGLARQPVPAAVPADAEPAEAGEPRHGWPDAQASGGRPFGGPEVGDDDQPDPEAGQ
jgi:hypothetical protein